MTMLVFILAAYGGSVVLAGALLYLLNGDTPALTSMEIVVLSLLGPLMLLSTLHYLFTPVVTKVEQWIKHHYLPAWHILLDGHE